MKPMPNLNEFAQQCHIASEAKGWINLNRTDSQTLNLMLSENAEALEDFRNKKPINLIYYEAKIDYGTDRIEKKSLPKEELDLLRAEGCIKDAKPCGIPIEFADTVIRIGQQCGTHKIDLAEAMDMTRASVLDRDDVNDAMADSNYWISSAWLYSPRYERKDGHGGNGEFANRLAMGLWALIKFCENVGIDLWAAVEEKMAYNETRPMLHGGKAI